MTIHPSPADAQAGFNAAGIVPPHGLPPLGCDASALIAALMGAQITHELGMRGPQKYDCYAMMQLIQYHLFGRIIASIEVGKSEDGRAVLGSFAGRSARRAWRLNTGRPRHGDAVSMAHVHEPFHVGTYLNIDRGIIVHCASFTGMTVDDSAGLRASGWGNLRFYSFAPHQNGEGLTS